MRHAIGILVSALLLSSVAAFAADERNVTIHNATGYGIKFIGVNTVDDEEFDENELSEVLKNGQSVYITFSEDDDGCRWNIKIEWELSGYGSPLLENVDLCKVSDIRLLYDRSNGKTYYQTR